MTRAGFLLVVNLLLCAVGTTTFVNAQNNNDDDHQQYTVTPLTETSYGYSFTMSVIVPSSTNYPTLVGEVILRSPTRIRVRVYPTPDVNGTTPYVVPDVAFPGSTTPASNYTATPLSGRNYRVSLIKGNTQLRIASKSDSVTIMTISIGALVMKDQYLQATVGYQPSSYVSGYGERNYQYFLNTPDVQNQYGRVSPSGFAKNNTYSIWGTDNMTPWKKPMYGTHPFVNINNPSTQTHVSMLLLNSHAQRATVNGINGTITHRTAGGIFDLFVYVAPSTSSSSSGSVSSSVVKESGALATIQDYHNDIGPSAVPPYWSLGTHQCRWGYKTLDDLKAVKAGYATANIPLQTLWNDIDYMDSFHIFTVDAARYTGLGQFVNELRADGQRYIQIIDPGVAVNLTYSVYTTGEQQGIFIKQYNATAGKEETMVGVVWPGWTAFPDFTNPTIQSWWTSEIQKYFKDQVELDGMWTDMNEIASFCGGSCPVAPGTPWTYNWSTVNWSTFDAQICQANGCGADVASSLDTPPFNPLTNGFDLYTKTLDMNATTSLGQYYNVKSFYGHMENIATHEALLQNRPNERPFIVTRATFIGSGRYAFHWTGDNQAQWDGPPGGLAASIQGVQASNLWGIHMVGSDIGGFLGPDTTEELIVRWYQLGGFYTFMRNHRGLNGPGQEPYKFSPNAQTSFKNVISKRYRMLPYIFGALLDGALSGTPALTHPSVIFSNDPAAYAETPTLMMGSDLLVIPVVIQGSKTAIGIVPTGVWYAMDEASVDSMNVDNYVAPAVRIYHQQGTTSNMSFPCDTYDAIPSLQRAGSIIPLHNYAGMLVEHSKASGYRLVAAMDQDYLATGHLRLDTNDNPLTDTNTYVYRFTADGSMAGGSLAVTLESSVDVPNPTTTFPELYNSSTIVLQFPDINTQQTNGAERSPTGRIVTSVKNLKAFVTVYDPQSQTTSEMAVAVVGGKEGTGVNGKYVFRLPASVSIIGFGSLSWSADVAYMDLAEDSLSKADKWKHVAFYVIGGAALLLITLATVIGVLYSRLVRLKRRGSDDSVQFGDNHYGSQSSPLNGGGKRKSGSGDWY